MSTLRWLFLASLSAGVATPLVAAADDSTAIPTPHVHDPDLQMQLFAQDPDIVTPVGIAVDRRGRVFVAENHTHSPPAGYPGPRFDRIKILEDRNGDGRAETVTVFAEGVQTNLMNLAFGPDETLYAVDARGLSAFTDRDGDGHAEEHRRLLQTDSGASGDHSGLIGVTVDRDGWIYLSRGKAGGRPWTYIAADGTRLHSYGDGGHIIRLRTDGTDLQRVATGFWNPFGLTIDDHGRLLAIDNDPDSRGPNRLLHIVPGGDYGFRARYGQSGLHPYVAWNGELPGTLPFMAGVGESPAGLINLNRTSLPERFKDNVLVTIWAENSIERFVTRARGASLTAARETLVKGNRDFRPVAMHAAPDGSIFITDWVKKEYPNHGSGRVWRLSVRPRYVGPRLQARSTLAPQLTTPGTQALARAHQLGQTKDYPGLRRLLIDGDPFVQATARFVLARPVFLKRLRADLRHSDPRVRVAVLTALRWAGGAAYPLPQLPRRDLRRLLADPDPEARKLALIMAGESAALDARSDLDRALDTGAPSLDLLDLYLATGELLTPEERRQLARKAPRSTATDAVGPQAALSVLQNPSQSAPVFAMSLAHLDAATVTANLGLVRRFLAHPDTDVRAQAVRALALAQDETVSRDLVTLACDAREHAEVRLVALASLESQPQVLEQVAHLARDEDRRLAVAAARTLRTVANEPAPRAQLVSALDHHDPGETAMREALQAALAPASMFEDGGRPTSSEGWQIAVGTGGDPALGELVFLSARTGCSRCHRVGARGGRVGPDLSHIASSVDRTRILSSILTPSDEVSPEFQAYSVVAKNGEAFVGTQWHFRDTNAATLLLVDGRAKRFALSALASYEAMNVSIMPQGLESAMTVEELRDLLAFLQQRK